MCSLNIHVLDISETQPLLSPGVNPIQVLPIPGFTKPRLYQPAPLRPDLCQPDPWQPETCAGAACQFAHGPGSELVVQKIRLIQLIQKHRYMTPH